MNEQTRKAIEEWLTHEETTDGELLDFVYWVLDTARVGANG